MKRASHDVYRNYNTGPGSVRTVEVTLFCTNPACAHSRRPHPITGLASLGSWWEPPDSGPEECPECDAQTDAEPLFERDDQYVSEEWSDD